MPTAMTHMVAGAALATVFPPPTLSRRARVLGIVCAALPDVDVVGFEFGMRYGDLLGHRGLTHSLAFAAVLAAGLVPVARARATGAAWVIWLYLFLATASHGFLDAFTDGGLGIAFLAPVSDARYFAPWRPIHVSPIGLHRFVESGGLRVLASEIAWVWLPCAVVAIVVIASRRRRDRAR